jgi:cob(I)alamin adenosyltransferase
VRIYTGGGDSGETGLFGGGRVFKDDLRVEAYGTVDELNADLGAARAAGLPEELDDLVERLQGRLFELGADLATPTDASASRVVRLGADAPEELEREIDRLDAQLAPLTAFILPGGHPGGAALHQARTVCRRAERRVVTLARNQDISEGIIPYLNRLSDLLFVMARFANQAAGRPESPWKP